MAVSHQYSQGQDESVANVQFNKEKYLPELLAEKDSLDPSFVHCMRLLTQEIERVNSGKGSSSTHVHLSEKCLVPVKDFPGFNFVGRLLGPRGLTLKRMQSETGCRMTIMGRGSVRDPVKEEEFRKSSDPKHEHLNEDLFVMVEAKGPENIATARLAAGVAEVKKMLIPTENDQIREEQLRELALLNGLRDSGLAQAAELGGAFPARDPGGVRGRGRGSPRPSSGNVGNMQAHDSFVTRPPVNGVRMSRGGPRARVTSTTMAALRAQSYAPQYDDSYGNEFVDATAYGSGFSAVETNYYGHRKSSSDYADLQESWQKGASSAFRSQAAKRFHPYSAQDNF